MTRYNPLPTADRIRELFIYDRETGFLCWRADFGKMKAGARAGCAAKQYRMVRFDGVLYAEHRVIWKYETGVGYDRQKEKWRAKINVRGRQIHLGFYLSREEARAAYARGALQYFGEFARAA